MIPIINQDAIDELIHSAIAKLPQNVSSLGITLEGKNNLGGIKYKSEEGELLSDSADSDLIKDFIQSLREGLQGSMLISFTLEFDADKDLFTWNFKGNTIPATGGAE